jgi:ketosteroid isomerase-like protein
VPDRNRLTSMRFALVLLLSACSVLAADATQEVSAALDAWKSAVLKGDAATLDKLYHKDLTYTHSSALVESKPIAIASATKPGKLSKAIALRDVKIRVYGSTAVVNAKGDFTNAADTTNHLELLMVWMKSPAGWQLLARQATKLP